MLRVKYASKPFGTMQENVLAPTLQALLLKLHVITGWAIPSGELLNILLDQFTKKILETYPNVNTDEFEYAFRNSSVKEWGKNLNLHLIDEVMHPYLSQRYEISRIEEQLKPVKMIEGPRVTPEEFEEAVFNVYMAHKNWKTIPVLMYDVLEASLGLDTAAKLEIMRIVSETTGKAEKDDCKRFAVKQYFDKKI